MVTEGGTLVFYCDGGRPRSCFCHKDYFREITFRLFLGVGRLYCVFRRKREALFQTGPEFIPSC